MPNKQYQTGVRLEREIVSMIKGAGGQATRTAGSHGWIDVVGKLPRSTSFTGLLKGFEYSPLDNRGFDIVLDRRGSKYTDMLYIDIYESKDGVSIIFLAQCKRKAVKHG